MKNNHFAITIIIVIVIFLIVIIPLALDKIKIKNIIFPLYKLQYPHIPSGMNNSWCCCCYFKLYFFGFSQKQPKSIRTFFLEKKNLKCFPWYTCMM